MKPKFQPTIAAISATILSGYAGQTRLNSQQHLEMQDFLHGQYAHMPAFFRAPMYLLLTFLNFMALLRHGNVFPRLPANKQAHFFFSLKSSKLGPLKNMVDFHITLVLFSYYELHYKEGGN